MFTLKSTHVESCSGLKHKHQDTYTHTSILYCETQNRSMTSSILDFDSEPHQLPSDSEPHQLPSDSDLHQLPSDSDPHQLPSDSDPHQLPSDSEPHQLPSDSDPHQLPSDSDPHQLPSDSEPHQLPSGEDLKESLDRTDINMQLQRDDLRMYHERRMYDVVFKDWQQTMGSKSNHIIMLKILIAESKRQNKKGLENQFYHRLMREAVYLMENGYRAGRNNDCASLVSQVAAEEEPYPGILHSISRLRLFTPNPLPPHIAEAAEII